MHSFQTAVISEVVSARFQTCRHIIRPSKLLYHSPILIELVFELMFPLALKEELRLPFLAVVRYLNGKVENNDCSQFHEHLRQRKLLLETKIGGADVVLTSIVDAFDEGYELLQQDPCYFLEEPFYMTE